MFNFRYSNPVRAKVNQNFEDAFSQVYPFKNIPLPYPYDALEPFIDEKTMELHHNRHLQTYIDNLNASLANFPEYQNMTLTELINSGPAMDEPLRTSVSRNAGGVFNHFFFFGGMSPARTSPTPELANLFKTAFGSPDNFKNTFSAAALSVFGSGYAYLVLDEDGMPRIVTTRNQMTPLTFNMTPLLCIDVWEHAYYLKHYNDRKSYIEDWFKVVNWEKLSSLV